MEVLQADIDKLYEKLKKDAQSYGYHLNPDEQFTKDLIKGLLINEGRYKYQSCPCRLSAGVIEKDRDIICPCDYRDADINDYGACYCGLYVNQEIADKTRELTSIPERRYLKPVPESAKTAGDSSQFTKVRFNRFTGKFDYHTGLAMQGMRISLCAGEPSGSLPHL